ncbi:MAG TPA: type II toxin-antitoxin system VapC family toxin [Kofleriaceae bacterium]|nr:type II toxin-antitoxin system VapC family toxin [Kofleriaceae bacterium]
MAKASAVLDTDVIRIALDNTDTDPSVALRRSYVELTFERLEKLGVIWVVPSPVVAELGSGGPADALDAIAKVLGGIRVQSLDEEAARAAGQITAATLKNRVRREGERDGVKFDALVFATAHQMGARWLLTGNRRDYEPYVKAISSRVEVVIATNPPPGQQAISVIMQSKP